MIETKNEDSLEQFASLTMIDQDTYELAVSEQFEKLAKAQTIEEIKEVLDTWPEQKDYNTKEGEDESH